MGGGRGSTSMPNTRRRRQLRLFARPLPPLTTPGTPSNPRNPRRAPDPLRGGLLHGPGAARGPRRRNPARPRRLPAPLRRRPPRLLAARPAGPAIGPQGGWRVRGGAPGPRPSRCPRAIAEYHKKIPRNANCFLLFSLPPRPAPRWWTPCESSSGSSRTPRTRLAAAAAAAAGRGGSARRARANRTGARPPGARLAGARPAGARLVGATPREPLAAAVVATAAAEPPPGPQCGAPAAGPPRAGGRWLLGPGVGAGQVLASGFAGKLGGRPGAAASAAGEGVGGGGGGPGPCGGEAGGD